MPPRTHSMAHPTLLISQARLLLAVQAYESRCMIFFNCCVLQQCHTVPRDILFIIRHHLQATVEMDIRRSAACAFENYERALRAMVCLDCGDYNDFVYGTDVWQWDSATCTCACDALLQGSSSRKESVELISKPSYPREFSDPQQWLEHYLSSQMGYPVSPWTLVTSTLERMGCEVYRTSRRRNYCVVSPSPRGLSHLEKDGMPASWAQQALILHLQTELRLFSSNTSEHPDWRGLRPANPLESPAVATAMSQNGRRGLPSTPSSGLAIPKCCSCIIIVTLFSLLVYRG